MRILYHLCGSEVNVSDLLSRIDVSQPNISQHLGTLYRGGVLGRRRVGAQVFYRIASQRARMLCEVVRSGQGAREMQPLERQRPPGRGNS